MSLENTAQRWGSLSKSLHWLIAVLILALGIVGLTMGEFPKTPKYFWIYTMHKSIGITVLGLAIVRLLWRYTHKPPALPSNYKRWEQRASHWAHMALYGVMLLLPISGWLHDSAWKDAATHPMQLFGLVPWPRIGWIMSIEPATKEMLHDAFGLLHMVAAYLLYVLWVAHVGGALKHQFIDKDPELQRMLP